jgi:hypothetical protein
MQQSETYVASYEPGLAYKHEAHSSGVSWAAVLGGAFVTAALSVTLLALGTGLGLSSVSPWANSGASAPVVGVAAIAWMFVLQIISGSARTSLVDLVS